MKENKNLNVTFANKWDTTSQNVIKPKNLKRFVW